MSTRRPRQRGIALLIVTWVFMILGVLAFDFSRLMREDAMAGVNFAEETQGYYLALAGMNRELLRAVQMREQGGGSSARANPGGPGLDEEAVEDPFLCQWRPGTFAGGEYEVRMCDENGLIPLNRATEPLLMQVITNLTLGESESMAGQGIDRREQEEVSTIVDAILDWEDCDSERRLHGAENDYYLSLPQPYQAKNAYFGSIDELLLVRGVTPALLYGAEGRPGLRSVFSVYAKENKLNLRTIRPEVLQIAGIDPQVIGDLMTLRADDPTSVSQDLSARLQGDPLGLSDMLEDFEPAVVTVEARADRRWNRNRSKVAAVIDLDLGGGAGEMPLVLRWLDRAPWDGGFPAVLGGGDVG